MKIALATLLSSFAVTVATAAPANQVSSGGAEGICQARARTLFPELDSWFDGHFQEALQAAGIEPNQPFSSARLSTIPMEIRISDSLDFVLEFPSHFRASYPTQNLICTGSLVEQQISAVIYNGQIRRPAAGEIWSF